MIERLLKIEFQEIPLDTLPEDFVREFYEGLGFKVTKNNTGNGIPDFIIESKETGTGKVFVEVKSDNDSLRASQLKWLHDNPQETVVIFVCSVGGGTTTVSMLKEDRIRLSKEKRVKKNGLFETDQEVIHRMINEQEELEEAMKG